MAPTTPQDFAQALSTSRLSALDWVASVLPDAAVYLVVATCIAVVWLCVQEFAPHPPFTRKRRA
jgi:hypothetical protein